LTDEDRQTYLLLLRDNLGDAEVRLLGWCIMTNHVHLIAVPHREDSLEVLFRRVHGRYAQYYNARIGRTGHLWQNSFIGCSLGAGHHLWTALAYVEQNPVRAGMVWKAEEYRWSSALAHLTGIDEHALIDMPWWKASGVEKQWDQFLNREDTTAIAALRANTYAGRPFGDEAFVQEMGARFGRQWTRGLPGNDGDEKEESAVTEKKNIQISLF
jgi:putative transposase